MAHLPIDLWRIIMTMSSPLHQLNIKRVCRRLHDNLSFDNICLNAMRETITLYLNNQNISYNDIIRYMIQNNNFSKSKMVGIIGEIAKKKSLMEIICTTHTLEKLGHITDITITCTQCNMEYECEQCCNTIYFHDQIIKLEKPNQWIYKRLKCPDCNTYSMIFVCSGCDNNLRHCYCYRKRIGLIRSVTPPPNPDYGYNSDLDYGYPSEPYYGYPSELDHGYPSEPNDEYP